MKTLVLGLSLLAMVAAAASPQKITARQEWKGSLDDRALMSAASQCITSQEAFDKLWKSWRAKEPLPGINFTQQLVLVFTSVGSQLNFGAQLDDQGNLRPMAMATRDLRPGFRYLIVVISREGIKSVDGKPLAAAPAALPKPGKISWEEMKQVIREGDLQSVMQTHALNVSVTLKDGRAYQATEPAIDDVIKLLQATGKQVPIATE